MDRPLPSVLLVGRADHREMRPVAETLADLIPRNQLFRAEQFPDVERFHTESENHPELVIVCQHWSEEYTRVEADRIFEWFPLACILCCYGSWCDSDGRSGTPWPPAVRVPVGSCPSLIHQLWDDLKASRPRLPSTASIEDAFRRLHSDILDQQLTAPVSVQVISTDTAVRDWLHDALAAGGFEIADQAGSEPPDVILWDAPVWNDLAKADLREIHNAQAGIPLLALIGGVRPHQIDQARDCGAADVLPKIAPIATILSRLADLAQPRETHSASA